MHDLARNRQLIYYALYQGKTPIVDGNGNKTGDLMGTYGEPTALYINKNGGRGTMESDYFGANVYYTATLCTADTACPINKESVLWIGVDPSTAPYNYVVSAPPVKTLNGVLIAIREVDVKAIPVTNPTPNGNGGNE